MFPGEITLHSSIVISGGAIVVLGSTQYQYMLHSGPLTAWSLLRVNSQSIIRLQIGPGETFMRM